MIEHLIRVGFAVMSLCGAAVCVIITLGVAVMIVRVAASLMEITRRELRRARIKREDGGKN